MARPFVDYQKIGSSLLIEELLSCAGEKAILIYSDAPEAELATVQRRIDLISTELLRRMAWG